MVRKVPPPSPNTPWAPNMAIFLIYFNHKEVQVKPINHRYFTVERQGVEKEHSQSVLKLC